MKRKLFYGSACLLILIWLCCGLTLATLAAQEEVPASQIAGDMVRVGIFTGDGYAEQDKEGHWFGIDVEMLENIAQTAGFQIDFVKIDAAKAGLKALDEGRIDLLADIAKTKEREERYLFSEYEQGNVGTSIFVRPEDGRWVYGDAGQIKSMTISCERDNIAASDLRSWCKQYGFEPVIREYDTGEEAIAAVKNKEVDGVVDGEDFLEGFRSILSFAPSPYYLVFTKSNTGLKSRIDKAMGQIYTQNPLYEKELFEKYMGLIQKREVAFTKEEQDYLATRPVIRVAVLAEDEPYFFGTEEKPQGVIPDLYEQVGAKTGLRFVYKIYPNHEAAVTAVTYGQADLIGLYSGGLIQAYDAGLSITSKYTSVSMVIIYRSGMNPEAIHTIALKQRSEGVVLKALPADLKGAKMLPCNTAKEAFKALTDKQADAVILGLPSATYLINQVNSSAYVIAPVSSINLDLCAVTWRGNQRLVSILNKGISSVTYTINGIIANHTVARNGFHTALAKIPLVGLAAFAAVMFLLVLFLIWAVAALFKSRKIEVAAVLAEAKAREQRIRAEEAVKSAEEKTAFFSNISHDMRTPLNAVSGFAQLALAEGEAGKKDAYLLKIKNAGALLNSLIDDTLTLFKSNRGKLELKLKPFDTQELLDTITGPIEQLASAKGVEFLVDQTRLRRRVVLADKLNLGKIFLNLLSNAVKFTSAGGHVWLTVADEASPGEALETGASDRQPVLTEQTGVIVVTVRDEGIGMSPEFLAHIFEPFTQERRPGYEYLGTGLGMSIVSNLVSLMGGTVKVQSEMGRGTTFTVKLPLAKTGEAAGENTPAGDTADAGIAAQTETVSQTVKAGENQNGADAGAAAQGILPGRKVLLCEDNGVNREIAVALLKSRGLVTECAVNGQEGVDKFAAAPDGYYGAILMDIRMPVLDGLSATKKIRALEKGYAKTIPVIAMSGNGFDEDIQAAHAAGMNDYVLKPIDPERLFKVLEAQLGPV